MEKIALGGGCHWCTEAVFQQLKGVHQVDQGYVSSFGNATNFSEGVIVHFDPSIIQLKTLIKIHLKTHSSTSNHSMRSKYRSAVYIFSEKQERDALQILKELAREYPEGIVTTVLVYKNFISSAEEFHDYYLKGPDKPFCTTYIEPKLQLIKQEFPENLNQ